MKMNNADKAKQGEVIDFNAVIPVELLLTEVIQRVQKEKTVNLKGANIIVSGGMGVGTKENFQLIHKLAHAIGAEVAGSRAAVDAGFVSKEHQVGQTGTTVRPKLYIAVGISGQIQHIAGMSGANRIIAINNDPKAPILQIAHYGIVGDLNEILPKFVEVYKSLKK
jgi:electron transfer flavoprotein alpha subunit